MGAEYYPHKCYLASKLKRRRIEQEINYSESAAKCGYFLGSSIEYQQGYEAKAQPYAALMAIE